MDKLPRIAVLMASYNGEQWIAEQIRSILRSRSVHCHIFLSDDGSNDRTVAVAKEAASDKLTLLPASPTGSAAQNFIRLIIEGAWEDYDYIALADQDDCWSPDKLRWAVDAIEINNLSGYSSDVLAFWPDGRTQYIRKSQPLRRWDHLLESAGPGNTFVFPRREAQFLRDRLRAADPNTLRQVERHDWLFYAYFREASKPWLIDARAGLLYRQHEANVVGAAKGMRARLARLDLVNTGWYRSQILAIGELTDASNGLLDYLRAPTIRNLGPILVQWRQLRRRLIEACAIAVLLSTMAFKKNR